MVVRFHTMDGKIKVYDTHREVGGGENGPDKYVTKCGMEWKREPKSYETCDHIDCALDVQRRMADEGPKAFLISLVFGIVFLILMRDQEIWGVVFCVFCVLFGLSPLIGGIKAGDRVHELSEYMSKGTINGMRAYVDPELAELTELKTTKECLGYGLALYNKGKYDDAIKAFDKAIELNPQLADAWNNKGVSLKAQNKYDEAIVASDKAIELNPRLAKAWFNKGLALGYQGKYDEAIQAYNRSIEIDPEDADVCYNKGMALRLLGRNTKADATLAHAKKKLNSKGNDLFDLEKYSEAIKAYDIALAADPKYMNAWINKGTAFFRLDRYDEAIEVFNQIIEIDPKHADAWHRKEVVLKKMGRKVEAGDAFARAEELGYMR